MYDKLALLMYGNKSTKAFLNHCKNPTKVLNDCKGSLRVEQAHTTFKAMKDRFKVVNNKLLSVLNSVENVNYNYLVDIKKDAQHMDMFLDGYDKMSLNEIIQLKGMESICLSFNCDLDMIKSFIDSKYKSRTSAYKALDKFKTVVEYLRIEKMPQLAQSEEINNHILQLIKECA